MYKQVGTDQRRRQWLIENYVEIQRILISRISLAWLNLDLKSSIHVSMTMTMCHHDIMIMSCVV